MKTSIPIQTHLILTLIVLSACNPLPSQNPNQQNVFVGKYQGTYENSATSVTIEAEEEAISGVFTLENQSFTLNGTCDEHNFIGEIVDEESGNFHKVAAQIREGILYLQITFPEHNYQVLELALNRTKDIVATEKSLDTDECSPDYYPKNLSGDDALVGKWRFTEVLSSGSGEFYASFSTDYFLRINSDGTAISWIGQSAGGSGSTIIEGNYGSEIHEFGWYTKDNQFFVVDPSHKVPNKSTIYYAEANQIMFSNGNNKRIFERLE